MFRGRGGLYRRFFVRGKEMPRGRKPFDENLHTRKGALTLARRRLERAYGVKGTSNFNNEELDELRQIFEFYDIDSSKTMDLSELNMALSALGYNTSEQEVHGLAALMDVDGDMSMDFSEFCMIVEYLREDKGREAELRDAFRCIDTEGSGFVTAEQLLDLLMTQGNTMSLKEASELIRFVDKNGDGKLDYEEFMRVILEGSDVSRSTTYYSTAASMHSSGASKSKSVGKEASVDELTASFKTASTSNTNDAIAEIFQMTALSLNLTSSISCDSPSTPTKHASTSLHSGSVSSNNEAIEPTTNEEKQATSKNPVTSQEERYSNDPEMGVTASQSRPRYSSERARTKLKTLSRTKPRSLSIQVLDANAGEVFGSVVLENPQPDEEESSTG